MAERHKQQSLTRMRYQQLEMPNFVCDSATYKNKLFIVRLDLSTLAAPILGYKLVVLALGTYSSQHDNCRDLPLSIRLDFDKETPKDGISCLVVAEHNATVSIDYNTGAVLTYIIPAVKKK